MKTYINKITSFFLVALSMMALLSCEDDFYKPEKVDNNHRVIYTSRMGYKNVINEKENVDFKDISRGVASRTWTFPGADVNVIGGVKDQFVQVFFDKPGTYDVKLNQQFKDLAYDGRGDTAITDVMDTTIVITVLSHIDITALKANVLNKDGSLGEELPLVDGSEKELPAGTNVRYTYETEALHDEIDGDFDGAKPKGSSIEDLYFDLRYSSLKTYNLEVMFKREYPVSADTLVYTKIFKGVPSDAPVDLEEVSTAEGMVSLLFSRDIEKTSIDKDDFSVLIHTRKGAKLTPQIASARTGDNEDQVLLELAGDMVYSDDTVWVSYKAGSLESTDGKAVLDYLDQELVHPNVNLLEEWGFDWDMEQDTKWGSCPDVAGTDSWDTWTTWYGHDEKFIDNAVKSTEQVHHGDHSVKVTIKPYQVNTPPGKDEPFPNKTLFCPLDPSADAGYQGFEGIELGHYKLSLWGYAESKGGTPIAEYHGNLPNLRMYLMEGFQWDVPSFDDFWIEGEWKYAEQVTEIIDLSQPVPFSFMLNVTQGTDAEIVVYFDEMKLIRWFPRP